MANYNSLKAAIVDVIKTNGNKEITGQLLQNSLVAMINSLGAGYQFAGVAVPATNPGTPDYNVFYFAGPGTYPNFNNATIPARNVGLLSYNGAWNVSSVQTTPFSAETIVNDIIQLYDGSTPVYPRTRAEAVFFDNDTTKTLDQQFSQLGQEVSTYKIDTSGLEVFQIIIGAQKKWTTGAGTCVLLPITPGKLYCVRANVANTTIAVLAQSTPGASASTPVWATGYTDRITIMQGGYYAFIAPSDAQTLYLRKTDGSENNLLGDVYSSVQDSINYLNEKVEGNTFPIISFMGDGETYIQSVPHNGVLLKGHTYRFYPANVDISGVVVSQYGAVMRLAGKGGDGTDVEVFRINRGTDSTFTPPEYIEYTPTQNIYGLQYSGRNTAGKVSILVTEDLGVIVEETHKFPFILSLNGNNNTYVSSDFKFTLAPGEYRLNIVQWDISGFTPYGGIVVLAGDDKNENRVILVNIRHDTPGGIPEYVDFVVTEMLHNVSLDGRTKSGTTGIATLITYPVNLSKEILPSSLDFPVMGCGNKMLSLPESTYVHLPTIKETSKYIFILYAASSQKRAESVDNRTDSVLCVISKATGKQIYRIIYDSANRDTIDGKICQYYHNMNMIDISDHEVVICVGVVNGADDDPDKKFLFLNKTYNADTDTISDTAKCTIKYGGNSYDLNLPNYIQMANALYSLGLTPINWATNSNNIWFPSKYDDNGLTKYLGMFDFTTSVLTSPTPYIAMTSVDGKEWEPLFLLENDLESGECSAIVHNNKIYMTNRIGSSFTPSESYGTFYGVCDMSGNMLQQWTRLNVQKSKPNEVEIGGVVYIIYNDGTNSGKYWGRTKIRIAKVNADYTLTEIASFYSPYGINYPSVCNHNGAMLIAYAEDCRGYNGERGENAITDLAIAQFYELNP